jgi:hypothetical protein
MMKKILFIVLATGIFAACTKDATSTTPGTDLIDTTMVEVNYDGTFMNGPYGSVSGDVKIYQDSGQYHIGLVNVMISNGPDLHVYLSKEVQPVNFIDLGKLRSTSGNQVYTLMSVPDFSQYKYVLIHCQQYNHLFGSAALQ